jgi:tetratricopeptide (TPR) repeat protein
VLTGIGAMLDKKGQVDAGLPYHREAWTLARRLGARYVQVDVAVNMLWGMPVLDLHAQAVEITREALAFDDYDGTPTLRNNLAWLLVDLGRLDEALPLYRQLAEGDDPTLRCTARARLVDIHARRGDAPGVAAAVEATLSAMAQTDVYLAHAAAMVAVFTHGQFEQAQQALAWRRDAELDPWLQEGLEVALAHHRARVAEPSANPLAPATLARSASPPAPDPSQ